MRRSFPFRLECPRRAIGAGELSDWIQVVKLVHGQDETRHVDTEGLDHLGDDAALDLFQALLFDRVHCLPEPPAVFELTSRKEPCGYHSLPERLRSPRDESQRETARPRRNPAHQAGRNRARRVE